MSTDEAIDLYSRQTDIVEYAVAQGVPKVKMVLLFDYLDKIYGSKQDKETFKKIEKLIAFIAEDSFDEKLNTLLVDIKKEIQELKCSL